MQIDPRLLPQDLECEKLLLGNCLIDREAFRELSHSLDQEDFAIEKHRRIWLAMEELQAEFKHVDRITVAGKLDDKRQLELVGGLDYLCRLDDRLATVLGYDEYARRVRHLANVRRTILALEKAQEEITMYPEAPPEETVSRITEAMSDLKSGGSRQGFQPKTVRNLIEEAGGLDGFLAHSKVAVPTPFGWLNDMTGGGLHEGELVILAARPSVGKSAVAGQFAETAALHGKITDVFSLEMTPEQLITRMACSRADVDSKALQSDNCPAALHRRFMEGVNEIADWPIYYDDSRATALWQIGNVIRQKSDKRGAGPDLVIIDYLQLLATEKAESRNNAVGALTRELKLMAQEFKCAFLVLSQLSRPENENVRPTLRSLRDSGCIEQDADLVLFLFQDQDQKHEAFRVTFVDLAKQRSGPVAARDMISDCVRTRLISQTHVAAPPPPPQQRGTGWQDDD